MYTNSFPQYDIDTSYHGYDLSRDVSEYKFDGDNPIDPTTLAVSFSWFAMRRENYADMNI